MDTNKDKQLEQNDGWEEEPEIAGEEQDEEALAGGGPGRKEAIRAMCFGCCGDMLDGRIDCQIVKCPLYRWQPYRKLEPDLTWRTEGSHLSKNRKALRDRFKSTTREGGNDA